MTLDQQIQRRNAQDDKVMERLIGRAFYNLDAPTQMVVWRLQWRRRVWINENKRIQRERRKR